MLAGGTGLDAWAQQFRAAWADVFHVGMSSTNEINTMVSNLVVGRYNAVIVQVLAYHDANGTASHGAHWKSSIVPWSTRVKSNFDPLAYLCQRAHAYGIEVHAWLGGSGGAMYRVSNTWPPAGNSILSAHPEWFMVPSANSEGNAVQPINGNYLLDMGSTDAQEYLVSIVRELVTNYEIDGIHWDDEHGSAEYNEGLGYPAYSASVYTNSGLARYRRNTGATGTPANNDTAWSDYRRRFKNELIARAQAEIQAIKTNPRQPLRHTSATMAYGGPPSTCTFTSEEAYTYFSDWPTMLQNGWLDAAIPMNYKAETNNASLFRSWCDRAFACWRYGRHIFMGQGAYLNTRSNSVIQLRYVFDTGFNGAATYSYAVPYAPTFDSGNWWTYVATNLYTNVVSTPPMPWRNPATATNGLIWGRVRNASTGEYVDDATVTVAGRPGVKSDGNGYYIATLIPASGTGTLHAVTASKTGFASQTLSNVVVLPGDIVRYDLFLNPPAAPTGLSATALSGSAIRLSWTDNATNETGYRVARALAASGPFTNIANLPANSTTWTNTGLSSGTTYYYRLWATNAYTASADSPVVSATTLVPPTITQQPQDQTVVAGQNASFSVVATGSAPLSYQWRFYGTNLPGAVASSYTRTNAQPEHAGPYSVVVSNAAGSVTSSNALLTVHVGPTIIQQPQDIVVRAGSNATFQVVATGIPEPSYQWRFNGTNLPGATASVLTLTNVQPEHAGVYSVLVSNVVAAVLSSNATLTVTLPTPPHVDAILRLPDGRILLRVSGEPGRYAIDAATNLAPPPVVWSELTNFLTDTNQFEFADPEANLPQRFYRPRLVP